MKVDSFCHIVPQKYRDALFKKAPQGFDLKKDIEAAPGLTDLDMRFKIMDKYPSLVQVLTLSPPPLEAVFSPIDAATLASKANDELANLIMIHPDRFVGAVAALPLNDIGLAVKEIERVIGKPQFVGAQMFTPINGEPMDMPKYLPIYEKMSEYEKPIWIHPCRDSTVPDYSSEDHSKYLINRLFGWPYETSVAIVRLVMSGILERYPKLKFITHQHGGMIPSFAHRLISIYESEPMRPYREALSKPPIEYCRDAFYNDTAVNGNTAALMCGYRLFGAGHILFGTDMPYGREYGEQVTRETVRAIQEMDIPDSEKEMIFQDNARKLLRLNV